MLVSDSLLLLCTKDGLITHLFGNITSIPRNVIFKKEPLLPEPVFHVFQKSISDHILAILKNQSDVTKQLTIQQTTHFDFSWQNEQQSSQILIQFCPVKTNSDSRYSDSELLSMLLDASPDDIYFKDQYSRFIRVNNATAKKLGLTSPEEAIGKTDFDFFERDIAERTFSDEQIILQKGIQIMAKDEFGLLQNDSNKPMWGSTSKFPMRNSNGEIMGLVGITRDITEKKQTELALADREEQLRLLTNNILDLVTVSTSSGFFTYISPSVKYVLGYDADTLINTSFKNWIHPDDVDLIVRPALGRILSGESFVRFEFRAKHINGTYRWLAANGKPLKTKGSDSISVLAVSRDETEKHLILEQLKENISQKDRLFSVISHDLRGPVASLQGLTKLLSDNFQQHSTDELTSYIHYIHSSVEKLSALMDELLTWSKAQFNKLSVTKSDFSLAKLVQTVLQSFDSQLQQKHISVEASVSNELMLFSDAQILHIILRNLLSNAIKYSHKNSIIRIEVQRTQTHINLSVIDSGIGISEQHIQKLLHTQSYESTYGTSGEKGTGLGLQICKDFVNLLKGELSLKNNYDTGITARVSIPLND